MLNVAGFIFQYILLKQATIFFSREDVLVAYLLPLSQLSVQCQALDRHQIVFLLHKYLLVSVLQMSSSHASIRAYTGL